MSLSMYVSDSSVLRPLHLQYNVCFYTQDNYGKSVHLSISNVYAGSSIARKRNSCCNFRQKPLSDSKNIPARIR